MNLIWVSSTCSIDSAASSSQLVSSLPWDDAPPEAHGEPDRYVYRISCEPHEVVLGERALEGPWRVLVERVRAVADAAQDPDRIDRGTSTS